MTSSIPRQGTPEQALDDLAVAVRCFESCIALHPTPDARPEEFQLYNGLLFLSRGLLQHLAELRAGRLGQPDQTTTSRPSDHTVP